MGVFGFCLAGGYAVHVHGLVERPSEDIDLFTSRAHVADFPQAVQTAVRAFETNGLSVTTELATDEFARLWVSDASGAPEGRARCRLARAHPPMQLAIGPVLHVEDAVANKVCALCSPGAPVTRCRSSATRGISMTLEVYIASGDAAHRTALDRVSEALARRPGRPPPVLTRSR